MRKGLSGKNIRRSSGAVMVEFAIVMPLIVLLMSLMINFGSTLREYSVVVDATRDAARFAAGYQGSALLCNVINGQLATYFGSSSLNRSDYQVHLSKINLDEGGAIPKLNVSASAIKLEVSRLDPHAGAFFSAFSSRRKASSVFYVENQELVANLTDGDC